MPLTHLDCNNTFVSDLTPLKGMPLPHLHLDFDPQRDTEILRGLTTLQKINNQPATEFWNEAEPN